MNSSLASVRACRTDYRLHLNGDERIPRDEVSGDFGDLAAV
jgi:hypothetical protein